MKDAINVTESTKDIKSEIISDQMENEGETSKTLNMVKTSNITSTNEDVTPKTMKLEFANTEIESENDKDENNDIKKEIDADMPDDKCHSNNSQKPDHNEINCDTNTQNTKNVTKADMDKQETVCKDTITPSNDVIGEIVLPEVVPGTTEVKAIKVKSETELNSVDLIPETETNQSKEVKTKQTRQTKRKRTRKNRSRPPKKKRLEEAKATLATATSNKEELENVSSPEVEVKDDVEYCLTVTNLPNSWSFMDIKNYIDTQCGPVDEIEMIKDDKTGLGAIKLSYQTEDECKTAMEKLQDKEIKRNKLKVSMSVESLDMSDDNEPQQDATTVSESPGAPSEAQKLTRTTENAADTKPWKPDLDFWEIDPKGLYGLKESFLKQLGITAPLDKWVHVSNFRCDKAELRDVLELAGNVLMCTVFAAVPKYANVMYSHPLEAVQAVSMLNGQMFYGQALKVAMDRSPLDTILLPKGLNDIGTGLGANGKPLRNIVKHYRRFLTNQRASINPAAFEDPNNLIECGNSNAEQVEKTFAVKKIEDFNYALPKDTAKTAVSNVTPSMTSTVTQAKAVLPLAVSKPVTPTSLVKPAPVQKQFVPPPAKSPVRQAFPAQNFQPRNFGPNFGPFGQRPGWSGSKSGVMTMTGPFGQGPRQGWNGPGPMGQMAGAMVGPRPMPRPMQGPMQGPTPGPIQGPMQGPMQRLMQGPMQRPMQGPMPSAMSRPMMGPMPGSRPTPSYPGVNEPVQLQFSNLPPSTTFAILCEKMAACGQVVSIQLTTPGCAVVTFANRMQADTCFRSYNNACVEGCVIQVKYS